MLNVLAISGHYISILSTDLGKLPRSRILLVLKAIGGLPRFVIFLVLDVLLVVLYFYLCLMFY